MAGDTVATQVLINGSRLLCLKLTGISDGTGEKDVIKVDASAYGCSSFRVMKIEYDIQGMSVSLFWAATAPALIGTYANYGEVEACKFGGIPNNAGDGKTGDILLTTNGAVSGSAYTITLDLVKVD